MVAYKKKLGFTGQLLIEPKPREPTKHQYDYDAQTVIGFLKQYGLDEDFKLNIEPNHTTRAHSRLTNCRPFMTFKSYEDFFREKDARENLTKFEKHFYFCG